jgi:EmrB/QacA subfamily drug resistance transporter
MQSNAPVTARRRGLALAVLCAMQLMIILDGTIVTVALPAIQRDLGFTPAGLAWVMNAYLIAVAGLLLLAGRLGDLIGNRRVFLAGVAVFSAASLLCGVASSKELLIAGRFGQGVGGALASAVILSMIVGLYPEPGKQARAMGIYSFASASGASIGLFAGGVVTQTLGWHWAFLINVPIGAAALILAVRLLATDRGIGLGEGADVIGAVLVTTGLSLGVYTIVQTAEPSTSTGQTVGSGLVAVALLVAFVARQATAAKPMIPLRIFRTGHLAVANTTVILVVAAGFGFQFFTALYLQQVLGFGSMQTGVAFLPAPLAIGTVSLFLAARLTTRFGARVVLLAGLAGFAAGLLLLSRAPADGDYLVDVLPVLIVMGSGVGLAIPAVIMLAMSGVDPADAGLASGLNNTAQQSGGALGLAVLATLAASRSHARLDGGAQLGSALRDGYSLAFLVAAGFVVAAMVVTFVLLRTPRRQSPNPATPAPLAALPTPRRRAEEALTAR